MSMFRDLLMTSSSSPSDPNTILLLHGDEFADASASNRPITYSNVSITNDGKFDKCFTFNTSNDSYIYTPNFNNFSESNWTLEWWENMLTDAHNNSSVVGFVNHNNLENINSGLAILFLFDYSYSLSGSNNTYITSNGSSFDIADTVVVGYKFKNQWTHRATVRDGHYIRFYQNGILQTTINMGNKNINTNFTDIMIGNTWRKGFSGKICEFRLSNIARYDSNFTPPAEPFN